MKCYVTKTRSQRNTDWSSQDKYNNTGYYKTSNYDDNNSAMRVEFYDLYSGHLNLGSVQEKEYKTNGIPLITNTEYFYSPLNYQISSITTTQSEHGNIAEKKFSYSSNIQGSIIYNILNQQNMLSVPTNEESSISNNSAYNGVLGKSANEFIQLANGDIKPSKTTVTKYGIPGNASSAVTEDLTYQYDGAGNMVCVQAGGRSVSYIYDYDDKYVVATVVNANATTDKPAFSGFETESLGGWTIAGTPVYTTSQVYSGSRALQLASSLSASLNSAKQYIVSFWATGNLSVSGGVLRTTGPTLNGFTYFEYLVQNVSSTTISGSSIVDELRAYPLASRMSTVAYDPLIGKISECDENNRVTYYEYDERGRIRYIKDDKKNILKVYEYQNTFKPSSKTYFNNAITETFTANNCQGDYIGKEITYSIAAQKYSSTISQADADSKAQEELNNMGQIQANNAGCNPVFYNDEQYQVFYKEDCPVGYKSSPVTYTVPARKYSSLVSKDDANSLAIEEIEANGDGYASVHGSCVIDNDAQWQADDPAQERCGSGNLAGHREIYMKDINPNSSTYNNWNWIDLGIDEEGCPISATVNNNLIINGDFESGEGGFETEYNLISSSGFGNYGSCAITTNPHFSRNLWCDMGDHSSGGGNMLMVDGSVSSPNSSFWYTTISVQPNTNYTFSYWAMNVYDQDVEDSKSIAIINTEINGTQVSYQRLSSETCAWVQYTVSWNSGSNTTADLNLIAPQGSGSGNDFAIDDISFIKMP